MFMKEKITVRSNMLKLRVNYSNGFIGDFLNCGTVIEILRMDGILEVTNG